MAPMGWGRTARAGKGTRRVRPLRLRQRNGTSCAERGGVVVALIARIPLGGKPSGRFPERRRSQAMAGETPVEIVHYDLGDIPWRVTITYRCAACGYYDSRISGGRDRNIIKALGKIEAAPYCVDCRLCRAGRCRYAAAARCCVANGRERVVTKQEPLPWLDDAVLIAADIIEAKADARRWEGRQRALSEIMAMVRQLDPAP